MAKLNLISNNSMRSSILKSSFLASSENPAGRHVYHQFGNLSFPDDDCKSAIDAGM